MELLCNRIYLLDEQEAKLIIEGKWNDLALNYKTSENLEAFTFERANDLVLYSRRKLVMKPIFVKTGTNIFQRRKMIIIIQLC